MTMMNKASSLSRRPLAKGLGVFSIGLGLAELLAPQAISKLAGVPQRRNLIRLLGLRELSNGVAIFSQKKPTESLWARVGGDMIDLAALGAAFSSPSTNTSRASIATASVLGITALDALCAGQLTKSEPMMELRFKTMTIEREPDQLYRFWHNFQNLPRFMKHLESVQVIDDKRSHWVAKAPAGTTVEWDAEITEDIPNQKISWRSLEGAQVENSGTVLFKPAPKGRGTEVSVSILYKPPAGIFGSKIAKLFGEEPGQQLKDDLYHFKQLMETGEIVQSDVSIHAGPYPAQPSPGDVDYTKERGLGQTSGTSVISTEEGD